MKFLFSGTICKANEINRNGNVYTTEALTGANFVHFTHISISHSRALIELLHQMIQHYEEKMKRRVEYIVVDAKKFLMLGAYFDNLSKYQSAGIIKDRFEFEGIPVIVVEEKDVIEVCGGPKYDSLTLIREDK